MGGELTIDPALNAILVIAALVLSGYFWVKVPIFITRKIYRSEEKVEEKVALITGLWILFNLGLLFSSMIFFYR